MKQFELIYLLVGVVVEIFPRNYEYFVDNMVNFLFYVPTNLFMFVVHAEREDKKLMILAVVAWVVRRSAHVISLILIFNVGMKDGLLHAIYSECQVFLLYELCFYELWILI